LETTTAETVYWPFLVYFGIVIFTAGSILVLSHILGERHTDKEKGEPFESGVNVTGSAWARLSANFYLIAILFVIFDLETIYIVAWALGVTELGWTGYIGALVFILVLVVALIYEWRMGTLDWGPVTMLQYRKKLREAMEGRTQGEVVVQQTK
jgi:NADH-quinone oxidoreductase subunit A